MTGRRLLVAQLEVSSSYAAGVCACGRPTRDHAYVCAGCLVMLGRALEEVPSVLADLETRLTASVQGIDYRAWAERRGAGDDYRPGALPVPDLAMLRAPDGPAGTANPTALPIIPEAVEARAALVSGVRWLVAMCIQARVSPSRDAAAGDVVGWLLARVDGMALHPAFVDVPGILDDLVSEARRSVSRYVARDGVPLLAVARDAVLDAHLTASECAAATVRVGEVSEVRVPAAELPAVQTRIRKRIDAWHHRDVIKPVSWTDDGRPRFRFGDIHLRLLRAPSDRATAAPSPTPERPGLDGLADWPNPSTEENQ